jgi:3-oxoacyl-[acyl-carrier protein] reductase
MRVLIAGSGHPSLVNASVRAFRSVGARVAIAGDLREPGREDAMPAGGDVVALSAVEPGPPGIQALVGEAVERLGGLDTCIRFTSLARGTGFLQEEPDDWSDAVTKPLLDAAHSARALATVMRGTGGALVLVGSVDAFHAYPGRSAASVVMTGLLGLVRSLGIELASDGIRANLVVVGPVGGSDGEPPSGVDAALAARARLRAPAGRWTTADEAAAAIRFVAGPEADFMTGQSLRVDGGWASLNQAPEGMRFP